MALPPFPLSMPSHTVVANISGHTDVPLAIPVTVVLDAILGNAPGSVAVRDGDTWTALPPGSPGQLLQTEGGVAPPHWESLTELLDRLLGSTPGSILGRTTASWAAFEPVAPGFILQTVGSIPHWESLTVVLDDALGHTPGSIMYRDATRWTVLSSGVDGQFLQMQGTGNNREPRWARPVPIGTIAPYISRTAPTGWVLASGGTIGDASSGATARANADTRYLWELLYTSWSDAQAPVSGGRGAGVAQDWNAHKTIRLPDLRGRVAAGADDMGGTAAGRLTAGGSGIAGTTLGASGGEQAHTLTVGEMANHTHQVTAGTNPPLAGQTGRATWGDGIGVGTFSTSGVDGGAGGAHNNAQPTIIMNYIIKL
jgi:microcystin-dependent protein